jgi:hypothetical protein
LFCHSTFLLYRPFCKFITKTSLKGNIFAHQIFLILIFSFGNKTYYLFFRGNHGKKHQEK